MRPSSDGNTFGSSSRPDLVRPVSQHSTTSTTSSTVAQQRSVPQPSRTQSALTDISSTMEWEVPRGSLPIQKDTHGYRGFEGQLPLPAQRSAHNHPQVPTHQRMHQATQSVSTDGTSFDNASTVNGDGKKKGAGTRKKKVQGPSQANGDELRRLLQENQGRGLNDVAKQVWRDEEGPKAEKSKQVFGMIWCLSSLMRPRKAANMTQAQHSCCETVEYVDHSQQSVPHLCEKLHEPWHQTPKSSFLWKACTHYL